MTEVSRSLIAIGALMLLIGGLMLPIGRVGIPRLPGDIMIRRGGGTFYFPIVTSVILSIVLTVLLNLFLRRR